MDEKKASELVPVNGYREEGQALHLHAALAPGDDGDTAA